MQQNPPHPTPEPVRLHRHPGGLVTTEGLDFLTWEHLLVLDDHERGRPTRPILWNVEIPYRACAERERGDLGYCEIGNVYLP